MSSTRLYPFQKYLVDKFVGIPSILIGDDMLQGYRQNLRGTSARPSAKNHYA